MELHLIRSGSGALLAHSAHLGWRPVGVIAVQTIPRVKGKQYREHGLQPEARMQQKCKQVQADMCINMQRFKRDTGFSCLRSSYCDQGFLCKKCF